MYCLKGKVEGDVVGLANRFPPSRASSSPAGSRKSDKERAPLALSLRDQSQLRRMYSRLKTKWNSITVQTKRRAKTLAFCPTAVSSCSHSFSSIELQFFHQHSSCIFPKSDLQSIRRQIHRNTRSRSLV